MFVANHAQAQDAKAYIMKTDSLFLSGDLLLVQFLQDNDAAKAHKARECYDNAAKTLDEGCTKFASDPAQFKKLDYTRTIFKIYQDFEASTTNSDAGKHNKTVEYRGVKYNVTGSYGKKMIADYIDHEKEWAKTIKYALKD